jgi:hypothetical protein
MYPRRVTCGQGFRSNTHVEFATAPGDNSFILKVQSQAADRNFESGRGRIVTDE